MSREIKFRAWDKFTKQMPFEGFHLFGEVLTFHLLSQWCDENPNPNHSSSLLRPNDIEIMQYTGLKDKNGKEIYEGDIVKAGELIGIIEWCNSDSRYIVTNGDKNGGLNSFYMKQNAEVIGNIHENPELL